MSLPSWVPIVQQIVERQRRTLIQFVADVYPWANVSEEPTLAKLRKVIEEDQRAAVKLAKLLESHHFAVPLPGPFPLSYAALFFVSLEFLLPHMIDHQKRDIAQLEHDLERIEDKEAWALIESLLQTKRRHLTILQELAAQASKPVHA